MAAFLCLSVYGCLCLCLCLNALNIFFVWRSHECLLCLDFAVLVCVLCRCFAMPSPLPLCPGALVPFCHLYMIFYARLLALSLYSLPTLIDTCLTLLAAESRRLSGGPEHPQHLSACSARRLGAACKGPVSGVAGPRCCGSGFGCDAQAHCRRQLEMREYP